jgi:hypothetical protein
MALSKYARPSPADLARRMYGSFTSILHTDHGIEEDTWDDVPEEFKTAFIEAMDMVVREELESMAAVFEREVDEIAKRKAKDIVSSSPPPSVPAGQPWIGVCYYCGVKKQLVRWQACKECISR